MLPHQSEGYRVFFQCIYFSWRFLNGSLFSFIPGPTLSPDKCLWSVRLDGSTINFLKKLYALALCFNIVAAIIFSSSVKRRPFSLRLIFNCIFKNNFIVSGIFSIIFTNDPLADNLLAAFIFADCVFPFSVNCCILFLDFRGDRGELKQFWHFVLYTKGYRQKAYDISTNR